MDWNAIGAVAELLAAVGVIISLIYLATQVRQSTRATRSATRQAIVDSIMDGAMIWPRSAEFARVLHNHLEGNELEPPDYQRLQAYCFANLRQPTGRTRLDLNSRPEHATWTRAFVGTPRRFSGSETWR